MTRSHWRFAAGAGLLAAGLLVNASGAVAFADAGSAATGSADGADPSSHSSTPATGPLGGFSAANVRATIQGVADALNPAQLLRPNSTVGSTGPTTQSPIIAVPQMIADSVRVPQPITGVSVAPQNPATPTADPVTPTPAAVAHKSSRAQTDVSNAVASLSTALASTTNQLAQATNQVAQATNTMVVAPATAAVAAGVQSVVAPINAGLASVTAPIPDVLTAIQSMVTSTADAIVPLTQVPSDLASMFGITAGVQPVTGQVGGDTNGPPITTLPTPRQTARPLVLDRALAPAISHVPGGTAQATATTTTTSGVTSAIAAASARNATARTAPVDAMSEGLQKFVQSYGALVVAASLSALIAAALPGILAFLIPTAAGMGVGYRQARAGIALHATGLGRFAGSGPIGIVRTGSMVTLRGSALRVARPARGEVASPSPVAA